MADPEIFDVNALNRTSFEDFKVRQSSGDYFTLTTKSRIIQLPYHPHSFHIQDRGSRKEISITDKFQHIQIFSVGKTVHFRNHGITNVLQMKSDSHEVKCFQVPASKKYVAINTGDNVMCIDIPGVEKEKFSNKRAVTYRTISWEGEVMKSGNIIKRGARVKNWKDRFFILCSDSFSYYADRDAFELGKAAKGIISISAIQRVCPASESNLPTPDVMGSMFIVECANRVYYCLCEVDSEVNEWVDALRRTVNHHPTIDPLQTVLYPNVAVTSETNNDMDATDRDKKKKRDDEGYWG